MKYRHFLPPKPTREYGYQALEAGGFFGRLSSRPHCPFLGKLRIESEEMFSLAIYTQAAVTKRRVIFLLFLLSLKAQRYFFKKKCTIFYHILQLYQNSKANANSSSGLLGYFPFL